MNRQGNKFQVDSAHPTFPTGVPIKGRFKDTQKIAETLIAYTLRSLTAHVRMLADTRVIEPDAGEKVLSSLSQIALESKAGRAPLPGDNEDVFGAVERRLVELAGESARLVRIANSRSDQLSTDARLWLRDAAGECAARLLDLRQIINRLSERDIELVMPGYAQTGQEGTIYLSQWWLANEARMRRDYGRLADLFKRLNLLPLGSSVKARADIRVDRMQVARELGFDGVIDNHLDVVSDRDYFVEFAGFASILGSHLSQLSSDLLLWTTHEFGFVRFPRGISFRGQMITLKQAISLFELLKARPAAFTGSMVELLMAAGVNSLDSQDMEEAVPVLFEVVGNLSYLLDIAIAILPAIEFDEKRMTDAANPDLASSKQAVDYLIEREVPRERAVRILDSLVAYCKERRRQLSDLTINEWAQFSPAFGDDIYTRISSDEFEQRGLLNGNNARAVLELSIGRAQDLLLEDRKTLLRPAENP